MSEVKQFKLPDVGEGLTEADIVAWHVKPGEEVHVNQVIVEIETAKAVVELPCPYDGVVTELLVVEGQTVDVGVPIIAVDVSPGADAGASGGVCAAGRPAESSPSASGTDAIGTPGAGGAVEPGMVGSPAPKAERQAVLVGYGVKLGAAKRRPRKPADARAASVARTSPAQPSPAGAGSPVSATGAGATGPGTPAGNGAATGSSGPAAPARGPVPTSSPAAGSGNGRPLAKPPVRKLAKDLGVDLAAIAGSGPNGVITREDVEVAAAGTASPATARPAAAGVREERVSIRGVRKHTAAAVSSSAFTAPHVTEFLQIDMTESMAALERLRAVPEFEGLRLSPLLLVAKALLLAAARHPMINSSWDEQAQEIVVKHYVNLGIAAATDRGLIVPNIKDAHTLSLPGLARSLTDLAATARSGKTQPAQLAGGTITITNVGVFGVDAGTPILTPGEAAILAFGQVREAPWVHQGQLAVRQVTTLSLSFDHRIVDGDLGSAVLRDVGAMLSDPLRMLAWC